LLLDFSQNLVQKTRARAVVVYADVFESQGELQAYLRDSAAPEVIIITRGSADDITATSTHLIVIQVPDVRLTRLGQIKLGILLGYARDVIQQGDRLVCLSGIAGSGVLDTVVFMEVGEEFEMFAAKGGEELTRDVNPEVFERILDIAIRLANEGREGKAVGALFVLGDVEGVKRYSEQLILNPFRGYKEKERNVLDPGLEETIKEFSTLDGAFLIRDEGIIETAGSYLHSTLQTQDLPMGLGARHKAASAITAATNSVAITISESTGTVTVFRDGKIIMEIERPRPIGPSTQASREFFHEKASSPFSSS
jgi:DNA integrity scanning protein DisA with diadenylate cyclase activity